MKEIKSCVAYSIFLVVLFNFEYVLAVYRKKSGGRSSQAEICSCPEVCRPTQLSMVERLNDAWDKYGCVAKEGIHCDCSDCICNTKPFDFGTNYLCNKDHCPIGKCGCAVERNNCKGYEDNPNDCPCKNGDGESECSRCDRIWCDKDACLCQLYGVTPDTFFQPKLSGKCNQAGGRNLVVGKHSFCKTNGK